MYQPWSLPRPPSKMDRKQTVSVFFDLAEQKYGLSYCIIQASDYIFICKCPKGKAASTHTPPIFSSFKESQLHASWRNKPDKRGPIHEGAFLTNWISTFRILLLNQRSFVSWNSIFKNYVLYIEKSFLIGLT